MIGKRTFVVSETPKAASLVKLSGNFLIASVIESLGEAMTLIGKGGVDKHQYLEILTSTLFGAPVYKTRRLASRTCGSFSPPRRSSERRCRSHLRDRFLTLLANGGEELDWSAIGALAAWEAGVGKVAGG